MPILIVGGLLGMVVTHFWHKEVQRQAKQEAHLNDLHEKLGAKLAAVQGVKKE